MVKLIRILWIDLRNSSFTDLLIEVVKILSFTILLGIIAFLTLVLFDIATLSANLPILQWVFVFLILGLVVETSVIGVFVILYLLAFFVSAIYTFITAIPVYIKDVRSRLHE